MPDLAADPTAMSSEELRAYGEKCRSVRKRDFQQLLEDESRHRPEHTGFIYILSNPAMPGLLKIGSTSGPVEKRVSQLNSATGVPEPFRPEFIIPVYEGLKAAERKAHAALNIYRQHNRREFFKVPVDVARYLLEEALGEKAKLPHSRAASSRFRRR
jgi:hypothetical protein